MEKLQAPSQDTPCYLQYLKQQKIRYNNDEVYRDNQKDKMRTFYKEQYKNNDAFRRKEQERRRVAYHKKKNML